MATRGDAQNVGQGAGPASSWDQTDPFGRLDAYETPDPDTTPYDLTRLDDPQPAPAQRPAEVFRTGPGQPAPRISRRRRGQAAPVPLRALPVAPDRSSAVAPTPALDPLSPATGHASLLARLQAGPALAPEPTLNVRRGRAGRLPLSPNGLVLFVSAAIVVGAGAAVSALVLTRPNASPAVAFDRSGVVTITVAEPSPPEAAVTARATEITKRRARRPLARRQPTARRRVDLDGILEAALAPQPRPLPAKTRRRPARRAAPVRHAPAPQAPAQVDADEADTTDQTALLNGVL